jgi:hypothetical protein
VKSDRGTNQSRVSLATAVGTIALHRRVEVALNLEADLTAVATTLMAHNTSPLVQPLIGGRGGPELTSHPPAARLAAAPAAASCLTPEPVLLELLVITAIHGRAAGMAPASGSAQ